MGDSLKNFSQNDTTSARNEVKQNTSCFNEHEVLHKLKHYLPAQAPLKDFIHHNTLHAFQDRKFFDALAQAKKIFGYKTFLPLEAYRSNYKFGRIRKEILEHIINQRKGKEHAEEWKSRLLLKEYEPRIFPRIGSLRSNWKKQYHIDIDSLVHPILFRIICSYLDQGISIWNFPVWRKGFLLSIKEMEKNSFTSFFRTERAKSLLLNDQYQLENLLKIVVGDESLYEQYIFDQQFAHQGWSGMVSAIEDHPESLLDQRRISIKDFIIFELLLEIDALDFQFGEQWSPLSSKIKVRPEALFAPVPERELTEVLIIWQEALEWTYYDEVLKGIELHKAAKDVPASKSFQAMFCIDDREISLRQYLETFDPFCETFATPGFFNVEFFFQPKNGKFYTKLCPAPVTPKYLIRELKTNGRRRKEFHFIKHSHSIIGGWVAAHTLGFWSAFKLLLNVFKPTAGPAAVSSFNHMDKFAKLTVVNKSPDDKENGLQIGYTINEMADRAEGLLRSIGLVESFASIVYVIGHGASSVNNPHYAAYDCGACSGKPGSVNARVFSFMANHPEVRKVLVSRGIIIPEGTQFIGGLHDTTRDEIAFYDESSLSESNKKDHEKNKTVFAKALDFNAKERSRRFQSIDTSLDAEVVHEKIKMRAVSLYEPRPELNHATNSLCIVGRRSLTKKLFLDRRAFMNSYDYRLDPEGKHLFNILKAAAPVCGGINLEYFFSRVDNQKLGAGTKLPHNIMGLLGVANGSDGDLRPGLPSQMVEVHDPIRLLVIVEHFPEVVLKSIQISPETYEWFINEWVNLVVVNPETKELALFKNGQFTPYHTFKENIESIPDAVPLFASNKDNFPVYIIS